jgi:D-glycero-beta-D-manno-heptose-7-phosphate kinase
MNNGNGKSPHLSRSVWRAGKNGNSGMFPAATISGLSAGRVKHLINEATRHKVLVLGDIMLDEFIWGSVRRISPEAPVPVVELERESFMPGGAANVARNLAAVRVPTELFSVIGRDDAGKKLKGLLSAANVGSEGCICSDGSVTTVKSRIIAHQQQVVRLDRECVRSPDKKAISRLMRLVEEKIGSAAALIVGDYGKGIVSQPLLDWLKETCRAHRVWLSMDPKPAHTLDLSAVSLLTPNRKEAFELAAASDTVRCSDPLNNDDLLRVAETLLSRLRPGVLLITLGEHGMLLCEDGKRCVHIPTVAKQVFDVSGAGDTVIAIFTAAAAAGASPIEAAMLANCAAGVVVGKVGTATAKPEELLANTLTSQAELRPRYGVVLGNRKSNDGSPESERIPIGVEVPYE